MPRVIFFVSLASLMLLDCSADISNVEEASHNARVRLSLGSKNFRHLKSEEIEEASDASIRMDVQRNDQSSNSTRNEIVAAHTGDERQKHSSETFAQTVQAAMQDMFTVQDVAQKLRSSVEKLGFDLGFMGSDKVREAANELAKRRAVTRQRLDGLALESHQLRATANDLDARLWEQYRRLSSETSAEQHQQLSQQNQMKLQNLGHKFAATQEFTEYDSRSQRKMDDEAAPDAHETDKAKQAAEDAQFAELEKETMKIQSWFRQLKQIKAEKDSLREKKIEAAKAAKELGLSSEEIADRLQHVEKANHEAMGAETKPSALMEVGESLTFGAVLAKSAVEMDSTEAAARDVMNGLQHFDAWKRVGNDSRQSIVMGLIAKEQVQKHLELLKQNEQAISDRVKQLSSFLETGARPSA